MRIQKTPCGIGLNKLKEYSVFAKIDASAFRFLVRFGGDGAPWKEGTATAFICSFLNVGERLASRSKNFLVFGANVKENGEVVKNYLQMVSEELSEIESKTFSVSVNGEAKSVEFRIAELPNDMKMLPLLAGELSNAARYFSTFGNVTKKDSNDVSKTLKDPNKRGWEPFSYEKRISDAYKVEKKRKELDGSKSQSTTKRQKLTQYIASLKSRQEFEPPVGKSVVRAKPEPLHLKNNCICEQFMKLLKISLSQSKIKQSVRSFIELEKSILFVVFVEFVHKTMTLKVLSDKIKSWFSETKREQHFEFRFRGKESLKYCQYFPDLVKLLVHNITDQGVLKRLHEIYFISVELRASISLSARIEKFNDNDLKSLLEHCNNFYRACAITEPSVSPSVWIVGNAVPFYSSKTLSEYGLGLGCNTMKGREQKHQCIAKYAENSTHQNRWNYIFMHEFMQLVHLRENGYDKRKYRKTKSRYIPDFAPGQCQNCGIKMEQACDFCDNAWYKNIKTKVLQNE